MTQQRSLGERKQHQLKSIARNKGWRTDQALQHYVLERLLFRLQENGDTDALQLKGSLSVMRWTGADNPHRPTEDMDFNSQGRGDDASLKDIAKRFVKAMRRTDIEDGLSFDEKSLKIEKEHSANVAGGKFSFHAYLGDTQIPVRIDVGFGNPVTPEAPMDTIDPIVRDMPAPAVQLYTLETTIAEKMSAVLRFGIANTRIKDIYDVWYLATQYTDGFDGNKLTEACRRTFDHLNVTVPDGEPAGLSDDFVQHNRQKWDKFVTSHKLDAPDLDTAVTKARELMLPVLGSLRGDSPAPGQWSPDDGWRQEPVLQPS